MTKVIDYAKSAHPAIICARFEQLHIDMGRLLNHLNLRKEGIDFSIIKLQHSIERLGYEVNAQKDAIDREIVDYMKEIKSLQSLVPATGTVRAVAPGVEDAAADGDGSDGGGR